MSGNPTKNYVTISEHPRSPLAMTFGILLFPLVEELDVVGPWEIITTWQQVINGGQACITVAESLEPVTCAKGLSINPQANFDTCPQLEFLLVPGGQGTRTEVNNPRLIDFIAAQSLSCRNILSVCTGAFLLHAAGLINGKQATTHWASLDRLRALGEVRVIEERFTQDGKIWCSAGISAGIDLCLKLVAHLDGDTTAGLVQLATEYFPESTIYGNCQADSRAPAYIKTYRSNQS